MEFTTRELAEKLQISTRDITSFENDRAEPSQETVLNMISVLGFPKDFFFQSKFEDIIEGHPYSNDMSSISKKKFLRLNAYSRLAFLHFTFLASYVEFPYIPLPDYSHDRPKEVARKVRELWHLGSETIEDLIYLLENHGVLLFRIPKFDSIISRYFESGGLKTNMIFIGSEVKLDYGCQYVVAQQLGHLLLNDPFEESSELSRIELKSKMKATSEFADELLLPEAAFCKDLIDPLNIESYLFLSNKWNLPYDFILIRAYNLELIDHKQYQTLKKKSVIKGCNKKSFSDKGQTSSEPGLMCHAVNVLLQNKTFSEKSLVEELKRFGLSLCREDVEVLLGLAIGTLKTRVNEDNVIELF